MTKTKFQQKYPKLIPTRIGDSDSFVEDVPNFGEGTDGSLGHYFAINCGFPIAYAKPFDKDGQPLNRAEFNSVLNVLSQLHWYWQYGGRPEWDERVLQESYMGSAEMTGYPAGVKVVHDGMEYLSLRDNNFKVPGTDKDWWSNVDTGAITGDIETIKTSVSALSAGTIERINYLDTKIGTVSSQTNTRIESLETDFTSFKSKTTSDINGLSTRIVTLASQTNDRINSLSNSVSSCNSRISTLSGGVSREITNLRYYTETISGDIETTMRQGLATLDSTKLGVELLSYPGTTEVTGYVADAYETRRFVNSSINALAAYYITYDAEGNAFPTVSSLKNATVYYNGGEERIPTKNDYAIVLEDEDHIEYGIKPTSRYVYDGGQWAFQYVVNNTPLTQAQVDVLNSGVTSSVISDIRTAISANSQSIVDLAEATATADTELSGYTTNVKNSLTSSINSGLSAVNQKISELSGGSTTDLSAIKSAISSLSSYTTSNISTLSESYTTLSGSAATADSALATGISTLSDNYNTLSSSASTADSTLATSISTLSGNASSVDAILAQKISELSGGSSGDLTDVKRAISGLSGYTTSNISTLFDNYSSLSGDAASADSSLATRISTLSGNASSVDANLAKAINDEATNRNGAITSLSSNVATAISNKVNTVDKVLPGTSTSADTSKWSSAWDIRQFVNSSIEQSTAFFRGSFDTKAKLDAVAWQTTNPSGANYVTNNDYAYVAEDETHSNEAWRYKYKLETGATDNGWKPQYKVNDTPFTTAQLNALNSGITASDWTSAKSTISTTSSNLSTVSGNLKTVSGNLSTLSGSVTSMNSRLNTVSSNLGTVSNNLSTLSSSVTSINSKLTTVSNNLSTLSSSVTSINSKLTTVSTNLSTLSGSVTSMNSKLNTVSSNLSTLSSSSSSKFTSLSSSVSSLSSQLSSLSSAISTLMAMFPDYSATPTSIQSGDVMAQNGYIEVLNDAETADTSIFPVNKGDTVQFVGLVNAQFRPTQTA